ncbi:unnamed protein product [Euphydryas editha]|uniref:Uncharacterized protein n=1 Tax=Euphydryas editha TaxID=104508 RepID=A0AAU9TVZ5_EUPED|nr:unnamed protein product [Euphydryas editha]
MFSFAMHVLVTSYKVLAPFGQFIQYVLPYSNMATKTIKGAINFNTKHLKKGDPLPPYNGKLRVYNMRYCPYAQRTILALNAKQLDYEVVNIDLVEKPEWLSKKSAFGKVPSIEIKEDLCIYESLVTVEYLDEVYPQRPLLPKDPVKKAFDKIIVEALGPVQTCFYKHVLMPDSVTDEVITAYHKALKFIEDQLKSRGTTFLDGSEPGYADYNIWPWFERIMILKDIYKRTDIDSKSYPLLMEYIGNMYKDPAVSQYLVPGNILLEFIKGYKEGRPNYELLNEN